ncbi:ROK family protein [Microbacterium sp. 4R-513]|uniref:ROK family protein n=1 Tax=Microbacterium sp. 4R-513 TaxID=2567934 RepID=UPI0013E1F08F|nr:ROK family protein [Microbacterium sp. 4R-513]QIG39437.1 ROK family protein [Microbacterium sp. 4R-513]
MAFDVGGTDTKSAVIDAQGEVRRLRRTPTPHDAADRLDGVFRTLEDLAGDLRRTHPESPPVAAGLVVPGIVDVDRGLAVYASNMGWRDAPIRERAREALQLPVAFGHDVSAAGVAEHRLGAGRGMSDLVVLVLGTGIAGTLIIGGRLHLGGGYAGEIGHSPVAEDPRCICGGRGCLEAIASTRAIVDGYRELSGRTVSGAREVVALAATGDHDAVTVWKRALDGLAFAVTVISSTIAPEAIVIGGGLSGAGRSLFEPLAARVDARLTYQRRPALRAAQLGGDAGLLGAALFAREWGAR